MIVIRLLWQSVNLLIIFAIFAFCNYYIYMLKRIPILLILCILLAGANAQEFRCGVTVNYQKLQSTTQQYETGDVKIFETMKRAIEEFVNNRRWTNLELEYQEKLDCSISIILSERSSATDFKGQISVQLRRPVYNSNYTSGVFNYIENNDFAFSYNESQPLEFDPNSFFDNLSSTLAYYCYIMLGMYFDSFSPAGGDAFFQLAQQVVQAVNTATYSGWDSKSSRNRYWFMENHTNSAYAGLRNANYLYHRLGLDLMTRDQAIARQNIIQALENLQQSAKTNPGALSIQQFVDVKIQEIVSIFTPAPADEQQQIYDLVAAISPINTVKVRSFKKK